MCYPCSSMKADSEKIEECEGQNFQRPLPVFIPVHTWTVLTESRCGCAFVPCRMSKELWKQAFLALSTSDVLREYFLTFRLCGLRL